MDVIKEYASNIMSWTRNNPAITASIAFSSCIVGCLTYTIPNSIFYSGIAACPSEKRCNSSPISEPSVNKQNVHWECKGITIRGYLLIPTQNSESSGSNDLNQYPCIIMAHGFGHIIGQGLWKYAYNFCKNGYVVLLFDYRTFGVSDGIPRNTISPSAHIQDWISAINYIKYNHSFIVDALRIGLWGTSFSGGHILCVASKITGIKAVVSQVPFIAFEIPNEKVVIDTKKVLTLLYGGIISKIRNFIYPYSNELYCRIMCSDSNDNEKISFLELDKVNESDSQTQWVSDEWVKNEVKDWKNGLSCRYVNEILNYKPYEYINGLNKNGTAVFYIFCELDQICPGNRVMYAHSLTRKSMIHEIKDAVHFDAYQGEIRDSMIHKQIEFFNSNLKVTSLSDGLNV
eukprot:154686_1